MSRPKHEPEVVRAKVSQIVEELRDGLRGFGWGDECVAELALNAEKRAMELALRPAGEDWLRY